MRFLTDFADQAVILPLCLLVFVALAVGGWRDGARAWALAAAACLLGVALLKILVAGCGPGLRSPSGHTASAALVFGGLLALALRAGPLGAAALAAPIAAGVGATRLALGVHTMADVWAGGAVGVAAAAWWGQAARARPARLRMAPLAVGAALLALVIHGQHLHLEGALRRLAFWLHPAADCPPVASRRLPPAPG